MSRKRILKTEMFISLAILILIGSSLALTGDISKDYVFYGGTMVPVWWITGISDSMTIPYVNPPIINTTNNDRLFASAHNFPDPVKDRNGYINAVNRAVLSLGG